MKDSLASLRNLGGRLAAWQDAHRNEYRRLRRERLGWNPFKSLPQGELDALAEEARRTVDGSFEGGSPWDGAGEVFDALCGDFMGAGPADRGKARAEIGMEPILSEAIWTYALESTRLVRGAEDVERARFALCAIVLDDLRSDIEDVRRALGDWVLATRRAQIDARPLLEELAEVANRSSSGGGAGMREFLLEFEESPYFKNEIQADLRAVRA